MSDILKVGTHTFASRLIVGSGKYKDFQTTKDATEAAAAEMITVAVRRVNITDAGKENLLDYIDPKQYTILPNTAGCFNADDAVRSSWKCWGIPKPCIQMWWKQSRRRKHWWLKALK